MAQYIDKDALVAEIKERIETYNKGYANGDDRRADALEILLHDLDTLEVKEEIKIGETQIYLNDDGGEPPYDGKQWLDLSCTEYEIPSDKFKDGDTVEMIIRKTQKGK